MEYGQKMKSFSVDMEIYSSTSTDFVQIATTPYLSLQV